MATTNRHKLAAATDTNSGSGDLPHPLRLGGRGSASPQELAEVLALIERRAQQYLVTRPGPASPASHRIAAIDGATYLLVSADPAT